MECVVAEQSCNNMDLTTSSVGGGVSRGTITVHVSEAVQVHNDELEDDESMESEPDEKQRMSFFSKELIRFSLFGRIHPKTKRPWNESLSSKVAEVQELYKNIPDMLYFSPSSVSFNGIGVYATNPLPKETVLGPYVGQEVQAELVEHNQHNRWLWEIYQDTSLAYFVDASNPKYGNWMNFIQCARSLQEQNLKVMQVDNHLYFEAIRDITMGEELLVWYDDSQYELHMGLPIAYKGGRKPTDKHQQKATGMNSHTPTKASASFAQDYTATRLNLTPESSSSCTEDNCTSGNIEHNIVGAANCNSDGSTNSGRATPMQHVLPGTLRNAHPTENSESPTNQNTSFSSHADYTDNTSSLQIYSANESSPKTTIADSNFSAMEEKNSTMKMSSKSSKYCTENGSSDNIKEASQGPPTNGILGQQQQQHQLSLEQQAQLSDSWPPSSGGVTTLMQQQNSNGDGTAPQQDKKQPPPSLLYGMFSRCEDGSRWQCEECKRLFSSQGSLRAHSRIHTGERPYRCQYCYRTFCQASTLRSHERLHTGEKPYKCKHCGRAFTQSAGLRSHLKTHRYDTL